MAARLVQRRLLDPRPAGEAARQPILDAVNIPFSELPNRVHELPPRQREFGVVGQEPLVREVVAWLREAGRRATAAATPAPHRAADDLELGHLWEPNVFLAETLPRFAAGRALELACGTGRDAIFMSSRGWDVTAVDILPDALALASKLEERYAPALRPIDWLERDLESGPLRFERVFDLITVVRYLHRPLFPRFRQWLRPGGSVLCETFTTRHRERHGRPSRDAHVLQLGELPELLEGFEIRHCSEQWRGRAHTARVWAVLPPNGAEDKR
jgi:SAM-dependent methyltransferase